MTDSAKVCAGINSPDKIVTVQILQGMTTSLDRVTVGIPFVMKMCPPLVWTKIKVNSKMLNKDKDIQYIIK